MGKNQTYMDMLEEIIKTTDFKRKRELRIKINKERTERRRLLCF